MTDRFTRKARVLGRLMLTTVNQTEGAPRVDGARVEDVEGRAYGGLVFGTGDRAPVLGWRGLSVPSPARLIQATPLRLQPVVRWLLGPRPWRPTSARARLRLRAAAHEVRCAECRVTWPSWRARAAGRSS